MKALGGGAPRRVFYQESWGLKLTKNEVTTPSDKITSLEKELAHVQERADYLGQKVQHLSESSNRSVSTPVGRKRTKSLDEYTPRHQQRVKKQRKGMCADALVWMEQDGYTPLRLEVLNKKTGKVEMVVVDDPESVFGQDTATDTDIDMVSMLLYVKDRMTSQAMHTTR